MPDCEPIGDRNACSETNMPDQRPTYLIRDQHTCLIGDTLETDMPNRRSTRDQHAWLDRVLTLFRYILKSKNDIKIYIFQNSDWTPLVWRSPMGLHRHVGHRWGISVSDGTWWSPMGHVGLRWDMSVSDGSTIGHVCLRWVSDSYQTILI